MEKFNLLHLPSLLTLLVSYSCSGGLDPTFYFKLSMNMSATQDKVVSSIDAKTNETKQQQKNYNNTNNFCLAFSNVHRRIMF